MGRNKLQPGLSGRIGKAFASSGVTRVDFCNETGLTPMAFDSWLIGARTPNADSIVSICRMTGVSADWLLGLVVEDG